MTRVPVLLKTSLVYDEVVDDSVEVDIFGSNRCEALVIV